MGMHVKRFLAMLLSMALIFEPNLAGLTAYGEEGSSEESSGIVVQSEGATEESLATDVAEESSLDTSVTTQSEEASVSEKTEESVKTEAPTPASGTEASAAATTAEESSAADATEESSSEKKVEDIEETPVEGDYVDGELIIVFNDDVDVESEEATDTIDSLVTTEDAGEAEKIETEDENAALVKVKEDVPVEKAITEAEEDPSVAYAQANYVYESDEVDPDEELIDGELEAMASVNDSKVSSQWYLSAINAFSAWDTAKTEKSVSVAVVDTGVDVDHEDLASNIVYSTKVASAKGSSNGDDDNGHGSAVAGIIAGIANNGAGIAGVSYNAGIVGIKANTTPGGTKFTSASLKEGIQVAINQKDSYNIRVINMSIASSSGNLSNAADKALINAIESAYDKGMLVVGAAGNYSTTSAYPCDYTTKCLGVTAVDSNYDLWSSSNYNGTTDPSDASAKNLCAPGKSIYSTSKNNGYSSMSGTSMSAPIVSAVAALVFSVDDGLSPAECAQIMYDTATDLGDEDWDQSFGYGMVNANAAVKKAAGVSDDSGSTGGDSGSGSGSGSNGGYATCTDVLGAGTSGTVYTIHYKNDTNKVIDIAARSTDDGGNAQIYDNNETPAQRFLVVFHVTDGDVGYYTIENVYSGKVLDVSGAGTSDGTNVHQWSSNDTEAQRWVLEDAGSGYYCIRNRNSGKVLDISGASTDNCANAQIWSSNSTDAQKFKFESTYQSSIVSTSTYKIASTVNSGYVVDVYGAGTSNWTNIQCYSWNGTVAQKFKFTYDDSTGYYVIANVKSGRAVDVDGAGTWSGVNVQLFEKNGTWAQKWSPVKSGNSYVFYNACNGLVLDLDAANARDCQNIQCYSYNGTAAQKWVLSEV